MNKRVEEVIQAIVDDIRTLVDVIMTSSSVADNRSSIRELRDSVRKEDVVVKASVGSNGVVIDVVYDSLLEWDRKPQSGKQPSVSDIKEWASSKGLPTDNGTINLARRSIWYLGHAGLAINSLLDKEIDRMMETKWADKIEEALMSELDEFFE